MFGLKHDAREEFEKENEPSSGGPGRACEHGCCSRPAERVLDKAGGFPLCLGRQGEELKVLKIRGGKTMARRLADMGLNPGAEIRVAGNLGGPMIVEVGGTRISLGRGIASKVMVDGNPEKTKHG